MLPIQFFTSSYMLQDLLSRNLEPETSLFLTNSIFTLSCAIVNTTLNPQDLVFTFLGSGFRYLIGI